MKTKGVKMRNNSPKTDKPSTKTISKIGEVIKEHTYNDSHQKKESVDIGRNSSVPMRFVTERKESTDFKRPVTNIEVLEGKMSSQKKTKEFCLVD
mmetsp:Transcript_1802/g.1729  ORF Transcript_1802/g.1729 Transcript_1802/m.1729 type:complete len:95 (-) Transcript_1802:1791-2075(-)